MSRMYFHLRAGKDLLIDEEGCEVPDISKVSEQIADVVRRMGMDIMPEWSFEITDATGRLVLVLPFSEVQSTLH